MPLPPVTTLVLAPRVPSGFTVRNVAVPGNGGAWSSLVTMKLRKPGPAPRATVQNTMAVNAILKALPCAPSPIKYSPAGGGWDVADLC